MKRIIAISLLVVVLIQCSTKMAIIAYYQINKAYIAAKLCENKAKPKMGCNGKCYLAKKLKAQEEGEKKLPSLMKGIEEIVLFCSSYSIQLASPSVASTTCLCSEYLLSNYSSPSLSIFQPPQA